MGKFWSRGTTIMEKKMFCYQREQTDTAKLQDELTGALIALARAQKLFPQELHKSY